MQPVTVVIFGASGDLTHRKLIPALFQLFRGNLLPEDIRIVGVARQQYSDDHFRELMKTALLRFGQPDAAKGPELSRFLARLHFFRLKKEQPDYLALKKYLDSLRRDSSTGVRDSRMFYLATPPTAFWPIISGMAAAGLIAPHKDPCCWTRVVIEKPFGYDLKSAKELNRKILSVLDESQVYRIDHYLGKETVQNIMAFRFGNSIFEPLWNRRYIDHVQITVSETVPVGKRAGYYDRAGALRDMVQNHLMQLLALTAMEPPASFYDNAVRDEKVKVLTALQPMTPEQVARNTVRGQYTAGTAARKRVPAYLEEEGVQPDSRTETFVALKLYIDNWRWSGVPFYLRTGKALKRRLSEVTIVYNRPPLALFKHGPHKGHREGDEIHPNRLTLRIQPDEAIHLSFGLKVPGQEMVLEPQAMEFCYSKVFHTNPPEAYERLILDAVQGDSTLFIRHDEVEASWEFIDRILRVWRERTDLPVHSYSAGSWGPAAAEELLARDGRHWAQEEQEA